MYRDVPSSGSSRGWPPYYSTIDLTVAILVVKSGVGHELDLARIVGPLVVLFAGPGPVSIDRVLGLDDATLDAT